MTANRSLDLLNPQFPAHKPANQQRRSPGSRAPPNAVTGEFLSYYRQFTGQTVVPTARREGISPLRP
ncbi:hypothetical protein I551_9065 [Mycobacterium ulcerans str. Harvey]|uniref:Uncharacterized protein n=1 Tax=Mycobacterium ulcerans str. Harvey TaxID=1299332 RepID=A0ABN0R9N1_MYCUL|nr:hypothetical protein I551_9065 [Mycobacterium ulcerans str. Harvey]